MLFWLRHEANAPLLNHLGEEGIDIRKNPIEFTTYEYELFPRGGILYNERAETSLPGLFAAGDEFFGGISGAAVFGWIAGESAAAHVTACDYIRDDTIRSRVADDRNLFSRLRERQDGPDWQEANTLLQQLMWDYAGPVRSETFLEAGLRALLRLRRKAYGSMVAGNAHDLMRALEVLNLIELGELTFMAALERKETRGKHNRVDYPFTNPLLEKLLVVKKVEDKPVMEWRKMRRG
jgi:succinate dehydrogenase/fumarate reductase flavoprotein subunit